jgi:hypothetical protein
MFFLLLVALLMETSFGEIIDRIAVRVGRTVITQSQIIEQIRVTAFLNGEEPDLSANTRRLFASRLVDVILIRQEMEISRYPIPEMKEIAPMWRRVQETAQAAGKDLQQELARYQLTEEAVRQNLLLQLTTLRFINYRFRPGISIAESEVEEYYRERFVPEWRSRSQDNPPEIDEVRDQIESALTESKLDEEVEKWLKEARAQARIQYVEEAFQ